jgi:predicted phage terminase large subunit-like protein
VAEFRRTVTDNPFIPITPTSRQSLFLSYPAKELLYGGAAGGGKSAALLASALQYVGEPDYAAVLLRRSFADLNKPKALIPLSHEWLQGRGASWDGQQHQWKFPSGATVGFGYLDNDNDVYQYQGAAYQFIGFDELTQFTEFQYRYLFSRCRRLTGSAIPLRVRAASNPGGVGHEWVKQRFLEESKPQRRFVSAKLEDNPYLDLEEYERQLAELDPVTRAQLRHGDWAVRPEGNLFKRQWFKIADARPTEVEQSVRFWDLAATEGSQGEDPDWTAGVRVDLGTDGLYYISDVIHFRARPKDVETTVLQTAQVDGYDVGIRMEQEPGSAGKSLVEHYSRLLSAYGCQGVPSHRDKVTRAQAMSAASERGDVRLVRGNWLGTFLDELCAFPAVTHDDQVDAACGAYNAVARNVGTLEVRMLGGGRTPSRLTNGVEWR